MRIAFDTNILVYAEGLNGPSKRNAIHALIERLPSGSISLPVQVLGELFYVLVRKSGNSSKEARAVVLNWRDTFPLIETSEAVFLSAADLCVDHNFNYWDAVVLSAAAETGCRLLLSEDMHEGFTWKGVTIVNPFSKPRHPLLEAMLS